MSRQIGTIAKINLKNIRVPYFVTGIIFITVFVQSVIYTIIAAARGQAAGNQLQISSISYLWLLIIMAAIYIPTTHFKKTVNLGGKRDGFFWGSITTHAMLAGAVSLINTVIYYTYERLLINTGYYVGYEAFIRNPSLMDDHYVSVHVVEVFGWVARGPFFVFFQQFAFLLLLAVVVHTLTAIQDKWHGWVTDAVIAAILATFIPIPVLRPALLWFLELILSHSNAAVQITACLTLSTVIYAYNRQIFARKAI